MTIDLVQQGGWWFYLTFIVPLLVLRATGIGGWQFFSKVAKDGSILAPATRVGFAACGFPLAQNPRPRIRHRLYHSAPGSSRYETRLQQPGCNGLCSDADVVLPGGHGETGTRQHGNVVGVRRRDCQGVDWGSNAPVETSKWKMRKSGLSLL